MFKNKVTKQNNAAYYFIDRHLNSTIENKKAFVEAIPNGRSISYKDLSIETNKIIDLLAKHNIRREERVLMLVLDQIEFPIIFWGCLKAGVIPVPVNTLLSKNVINSILNDCRAKTIFISEEIQNLIPNPSEIDNPIENIFLISKDNNFKEFKHFKSEMDLCVPQEPLIVLKDEPAFWLYSSGSTG